MKLSFLQSVALAGLLGCCSGANVNGKGDQVRQTSVSSGRVHLVKGKDHSQAQSGASEANSGIGGAPGSI